MCPAATAGGQGKEHAPATAARLHTARPVKDSSNYRLERSDWQSPLYEGDGGREEAVARAERSGAGAFLRSP